MASFLSRFFGTTKTAAQTPSATDSGGWIGYYGLSEWYEELSDEEKDLLRDANQHGIGVDGDDLSAGEEVSGSRQTRSGWLNVIATNIQRQNLLLLKSFWRNLLPTQNRLTSILHLVRKRKYFGRRGK